MSLPDASSIDRTDAVLQRMSDIAMKAPGVEGTFAITGLQSIHRHEPDERGDDVSAAEAVSASESASPPQSAEAIAGLSHRAISQIQEGFCLVLLPPPVQGIGQAGGFKMQVEDRSGRATPQQLQAATGALIADASKDPRIMAAFSSFRASVPQLYANVDRVKAKKENVAVTDVFQTLQVYLGSFYINDFNYLGRTYKVIAQADAPFRAHGSDVAQLKTRNAAGAMVPLGNRDGFEGYRRCRPHQSLQSLSLRRDQRRRRAGSQQRPGDRDHGEHRHERASGRLHV